MLKTALLENSHTGLGIIIAQRERLFEELILELILILEHRPKLDRALTTNSMCSIYIERYFNR